MTTPGWFPDPDDPTARRYWDGTSWSAPLHEDEGETPAASSGTVRAKPWALIVAAGALATGLGVFAVYWFAFHVSTMTVRGTLDIEGSKNAGVYTVSAPDTVGNTTCEGSGGYSDISQGVAVRVSNSSGKTIGTGALEEGIFIPGTGACIFGFQVTVPDNIDSYGITISHRGTLQFSRSQMKSGPDLSLGTN